MSSTVTAPPGLSFAERDRRWAAVRSLMREHEVDYLLVAGFRAREMYESYIADDYNDAIVAGSDDEAQKITDESMRYEMLGEAEIRLRMKLDQLL